MFTCVLSHEVPFRAKVFTETSFKDVFFSAGVAERGVEAMKASRTAWAADSKEGLIIANDGQASSRAQIKYSEMFLETAGEAGTLS